MASSRAISNNAFAFPILLKKGTNQFYIRIQSQNSIQFTPTIYSESSFYKEMNQRSIIQGLFYGWLLVMFLYNLFLFFTTKDKNFILMCLLTVSNGLLFISVTGYGLEFLWRDALAWNQISFIVFATLVSVFSILFSASFLELKTKHKTLYKYHKIIGCTLLLLLICTLFLEYHQLIKPMMLIILHNSFFFPITAIIAYKKGNKRAKYILIAWFVYLIGTLIALNSGTNITLPDWLKSFNILQIGAALEVLLFSIALGDTINHLKEKVLLKEVEKINLKNTLITEHNIRLERTVEVRVKELREANTIKDKFFAIIAHDLRSSVTSFNGMGKIMNHYLGKNHIEKATTLSHKIDRASAQLSVFLDNLLNWSFTQLDKVPYHPKNINLETICKKEISFKQELLSAKEIQIQFTESSEKNAFADEDGIGLVVGNLLNNAIKFTPQKGIITFDFNRSNDKAVLKISDNGVGMSVDKQKELFTLKRHNTSVGTAGEKGSGLGLLLCKEFVELNKGRILINSEENKGTSINIELPISE